MTRAGPGVAGSAVVEVSGPSTRALSPRAQTPETAKYSCSSAPSGALAQTKTAPRSVPDPAVATRRRCAPIHPTRQESIHVATTDRRHRLGGDLPRYRPASGGRARRAGRWRAAGHPASPRPAPAGRPHRHPRAGLAVRSPQARGEDGARDRRAADALHAGGRARRDRKSRRSDAHIDGAREQLVGSLAGTSTAWSTRSRPSPRSRSSSRRRRSARSQRSGQAASIVEDELPSRSSPRARARWSRRPRPTRSAATAPASTSPSSTPASTRRTRSCAGRGRLQGRLRGVLLGRRNCPGGVTSSTAAGSGVNCTYAAEGCQHGTHVAGIAAGAAPRSRGVARDAKLIAINVFSRFTGANCAGAASPCTQSFASDQIKGLERVLALRTSLRIAAVNMSLGGGNSRPRTATATRARRHRQPALRRHRHRDLLRQRRASPTA